LCSRLLVRLLLKYTTTLVCLEASVKHITTRVEHLPLGKLLISSGIAVLGDNPVSWRTLPILFGTANIVLLYLICRRLRISRTASNIAVFLLTFENLSFVHGGLTMFDVFSLTSSTVGHPFATRPWIWLIMPKVMPYFYNPNYFGAISFNLWALIIPAFLYMIFRAVKKDEAGFFGSAWFISTYVVWIFIALITDRVTYIYYFYPAVGAICIGIGIGFSRLVDFWREKQSGKLKWGAIMFVVFFLLLHLGIFIMLAPVNPWQVQKLLVPSM